MPVAVGGSKAALDFKKSLCLVPYGALSMSSIILQLHPARVVVLGMWLTKSGCY